MSVVPSLLAAWVGLQLVVVVLALTAEWAVRYSAPGANRWLRGLLALALVGLALVFGTVGASHVSDAPVDVRSSLSGLGVGAVQGGLVRMVPFAAGSNATLTAETALPDVSPPSPVLSGSVQTGLLGVVLLGALLGFALVGRQIRRQHDRIDAASVRNRVGRVTIAVHPGVSGPCAVLDLRPLARLRAPRAVVLLDPRTAFDRGESGRLARDLAVRHELAHLRHGDLFAALGLSVLVAISLPNPAAWRLSRHLAELDEHLVDHTLLAAGVSPRAYGRLLLAVHTPHPQPFPASMPAPGLAHTTPLHRRLHMLTRAASRSTARWPFALAALAALASPVVPGLLALPLVESPAQAKPLAPNLAADLDAVDHPLVDAAEARFTATDRGRRFVATALSRRDNHRAFLHDALSDAGLPTALEAVVFVESAYDDQLSTNDLEEGDSAAPAGGPIGAGLWMFIPSTARTYGLTVTKDHDERLDAKLETEAAIALLTDLHDAFGDWGLALAGYNQGAAHVRRAIETHGTRDVMRLVEIGPENGGLNRYVPTVWAAARVLETAD
jgi:hypothetical protein